MVSYDLSMIKKSIKTAITNKMLSNMGIFVKLVTGFSAASEPFQLHQGEISHKATITILIHYSLNFSHK